MCMQLVIYYVQKYVWLFCYCIVLLLFCSKKYSDSVNQAVVRRLVIEAKAQDESVTSTYVKGWLLPLSHTVTTLYMVHLGYAHM